MKNVTATFPSAEAAHAAAEALHAADIPDADITVQDVADGGAMVSAIVDDSKLDAAAAILKKGAAANIEDRSGTVKPNVEGHPDGSGPVVMPLVPER